MVKNILLFIYTYTLICFGFCRVRMSIEPTTDSSIPLSEKVMEESSTNTLSLFKDSVFNDAYDKFKDHLDKELVPQNILDRCLMRGLQFVQKNDREMAQVVPTLQLLLQNGAQWKDGKLLEYQLTPYHLICKSIGDHHELLDLMISISGQALVDTRDEHSHTALLYAVQNANINCVRSLITNGSDVNMSIGSKIYERYGPCGRNAYTSPLVDALTLLLDKKTQSTIIMTEILDLLLESGVDVNLPNSYYGVSPMNIAINKRNVECAVKLIQKGAHLNATDVDGYSVWARAAAIGSVEVLKCMFEHGINKNSKDPKLGDSLLCWVVGSCSIEALRYLLELGVSFPKSTPDSEFQLCQRCGTNRLIFTDRKSVKSDPCMQAVHCNATKVVELFEEYGSPSSESFEAVRDAVQTSRLESLKYLLSKHTYPINIDYMAVNNRRSGCGTLLTEECYSHKVKITKLLLDHGADPNKKSCKGKSASPLLDAIQNSHEEIIALYIRSGVDVNLMSCDYRHGDVIPFEAAILHGRLYGAEMLLLSGCSCGMYSLGNSDMTNIPSDLKELMDEWNVHENNAIPLKQLCRKKILSHLSPQADNKITNLPLPTHIITYLGIPELDGVLAQCKTYDRFRCQFTYQL